MKRYTPGILLLTASIAGCGGGGQNIIGPELFAYSATSEVTGNNPMRFRTAITVRNSTSTRHRHRRSAVQSSARSCVRDSGANGGATLGLQQPYSLPARRRNIDQALAAGKSVTYTANGDGS